MPKLEVQNGRRFWPEGRNAVFQGKKKKLECLQLRETGAQADFSVVVIKYRAICFVQMVDGASHGSGWARCSVKAQQQLLVSVYHTGGGSGSLGGAGGASTQRGLSTSIEMWSSGRTITGAEAIRAISILGVF